MRGSKSVLLVTIFALSLLSPMVSGQNDIVESSVEQMQDRMPFRGENFPLKTMDGGSHTGQM